MNNYDAIINAMKDLEPVNHNYSPYDCPTCGWEPPAFEGKFYKANDKKYPVFSNRHQYFNGSFDMDDWDETHFCPHCEKEFTFTNGAV